jgi:hypothetical protein
MKRRTAIFKTFAAIGAVIGYGSLIGFVYLVGTQVYRWFREGEWTHIGLDHGLRTALAHCCVKDGDTGRFATFARWLDAPADWLGMHRVFEVVPATLALFALSILGNCLFIYFRDRLDR